jgi:hypothetical protein
MLSGDDDPLRRLAVAGHVPAAELIRRRGVRPVESVQDLAQDGIFESDEEVEEFLAALYAWRHAGSDAAAWSPGLDD